MNPLICLDIEVLPNYFLIAVKGLKNRQLLTMDMYGADTVLDLDQRKKLHTLLTKYTSFGFNSINYDMPLINYALTGASCHDIYLQSVNIIEGGQASWMTYRKLGIEPRDYDHFDVAEPSPAVMIGLKNYGTRVGSPKLQEFYLDPHKEIDESEVKALNDYCENDLNVTIDLYHAIEDRIELRIEMSEQYGLDLRSKSDAQIAEAVISSELQALGVTARKPELPSDYKATYEAPEFIEFESDELNEIVDMIHTLKFDLGSNGAVKMPKELANKKIKVGNTVYKMGMGGLHSQEKSISVVSDKHNVMRNADFTSYYPFVILGLKLFPKHLSAKFLGVYGKIINDRVSAKQKVAELKKELKYVISQQG